MLEFKTAAELIAHYAALGQRMKNLAPPKPATVALQQTQEPDLEPPPKPAPKPAVIVIEEGHKFPPRGYKATRFVIKAAQRHFRVSRNDLVGDHRTPYVVHARQVAMYVTQRLSRRTCIQIGLDFGGRDHTTVIHACRNIETKLFDPSVEADIEAVKRIAKEICPWLEEREGKRKKPYATGKKPGWRRRRVPLTLELAVGPTPDVEVQVGSAEAHRPYLLDRVASVTSLGVIDSRAAGDALRELHDAIDFWCPRRVDGIH